MPVKGRMMSAIPRLTLHYLWLIFLFPLSACNMSGQSNLSGRLIYANGSNVIQWIDLRTLKNKILYQAPFGIFIKHLTKKIDNKVLFEDCDGTRSPNCLIKEFDIDNSSVKTLRSGQMPTYVAESNSVFFYDSPSGNGEKWLFVADMNTIEIPHKIAKAPSMHTENPKSFPYSWITPVIQISPDEVVFVREDDRVWIYDISKSSLIPTGIRDSLPKIWRSQTKQLVCYNWRSKEFVQVDLNSNRSEKLPEFKMSSGFVYIPNTDNVIFGENSSYLFISERSDIFAFSFTDRAKAKLVSHSSISSGIWLNLP